MRSTFWPSNTPTFQLHTRRWFMKVLDATDHEEAQTLKLPPYHKPGERMAVSDMTWLPEMPGRSGQTGTRDNETAKRGRHEESTANLYPPGKQSEHKKPRLTVMNPQRNRIFEEFDIKIANTKFRVAMGKVGPPPTVQREGQTIPMCASYHLRGQCNSLCTRTKDHAPHSAEEDQELHRWCSKAFA